ncbi:hypothetical protein [Mycolicibacterium conceptionense]|nr:hypothetical protein [Mycolicibacterium conceptionense]
MVALDFDPVAVDDLEVQRTAGASNVEDVFHLAGGNVRHGHDEV